MKFDNNEVAIRFIVHPVTKDKYIKVEDVVFLIAELAATETVDTQQRLLKLAKNITQRLNNS